MRLLLLLLLLLGLATRAAVAPPRWLGLGLAGLRLCTRARVCVCVCVCVGVCECREAWKEGGRMRERPRDDVQDWALRKKACGHTSTCTATIKGLQRGGRGRVPCT